MAELAAGVNENWVLEIFLRGTSAFLAVILITRVVGKSQMGQLTVTDFVNGIVVGSLAAAMIVDLRTPALYYVFSLILIAALTIGVECLTLRNRIIRKIFEDEPTIVIHNGKVLEDKMARMRYHMDDLMMLLREKNVFNIADVEFAVAEPNGELSVLLKSQKRPVTPEDLQIPTKYEGMSTELVMDGVVIKQNLVQNGLTEEWLFGELEKRGITKIENVTLATLDTQGNLYIDLRRDVIEDYTDADDR